ncbi:acyl carrier protein [Streptomyces galbus]|uniref:Acyl carrier protein n=1 Tax=Streptomyces galbus TaxID=33898 RepID=A0ABX1IUH3_STRGB|nr:acyl carrier protein [Streptomyces galbus]NKQ29249.1 acyl carrier protein [Streptomyces galbus]
MTTAEAPAANTSAVLEQISTTIQEAVAETEAPITLDAALGADLGIDSMSVVEILVQVEKRFGFQLKDAEVTGITTVRDILDAVLRRQ